MPQREQWRLYQWLRERAVYLDIETDSFGQITVVGCYGHGRFTSFVRGESLDAKQLADELCRYDLLVTFCGTTFDVPMLLAQYPNLPLVQPHIDLCFMGRQLGYRGGLKAIETQLDIIRAADLHGLNGHDAVLLWNRWQHSHDREARERLLGYNEADCVNLEQLADTFYCEMVRQLELNSSVSITPSGSIPAQARALSSPRRITHRAKDDYKLHEFFQCTESPRRTV